MIVLKCSQCKRDIVDTSYLKVLNKNWHFGCLRCSSCQCTLESKCYTRDGYVYCQNDFFRQIWRRCSGCNKPIAADELVHRVHDYVYHSACLCCYICKVFLEAGSKIYIVHAPRQVLCERDYLIRYNPSQLMKNSLQMSSSYDVGRSPMVLMKDNNPSSYQSPCSPLINSDNTSNHSNGYSAHPDSAFLSKNMFTQPHPPNKQAPMNNSLSFVSHNSSFQRIIQTSNGVNSPGAESSLMSPQPSAHGSFSLTSNLSAGSAFRRTGSLPSSLSQSAMSPQAPLSSGSVVDDEDSRSSFASSHVSDTDMKGIAAK